MIRAGKVLLVPRGIRNNNAGNLKYVPGMQWDGMTGVDSDGFVIFIGPLFGLRALAITLHTYARRDGVRTMEELIARYAPGGKMSEDSYASFVSQDVGVAKNQVVDVVHLIPLIGFPACAGIDLSERVRAEVCRDRKSVV